MKNNNRKLKIKKKLKTNHNIYNTVKLKTLEY